MPSVNLFYSPTVRRVPRVRAFVDFVTKVFAGMQKKRDQPLHSTPRPRWLTTRYTRASSMPPGER